RGANHPVRELATGRVLVTVQNHGYAVLADTEEHISHVSLNDGSVEGLVGDGFASVQFHPEAAPGPLDALPFFDRIASACRNAPTFARSGAWPRGRFASARRASSTTRARRRAACCGGRATASCSSTRTRRRS